ncbi:hypothetical protein GQ457_08G031640 [Hibiscus cannabinus]
MASVNETVIVLIPKVDKPTSMRQLLPISLCTVIYKTVSKVLVNRMKFVLPNCISSTQVAFVQGRAITDNILVAHELVHILHTSVSRTSQGAVFKLDMEKAFDRVEWPFLKAVMLWLGFVQSWVDLIMRCVSSVSSRVRLRGTLSEAFLPRRVLRQGDPLSPFLFLFCTEGLSAALTTAQREGRLPGVRASKHGPPEVSDPGIYLGVPLLIGKNKYAAFGRYRDNMDTRVSKSLVCLYVTIHVLIKSIAQALPQYVMSCYLLPCSLVEEMSRSIRRFWWSGKGSTRGWPFVAWADLCQPKAAGGMAFKDLHLFNIALLGKQLWCLLSEPGSLLYRTFRAKYFPDGDLLHASVPACSSFSWKGLHHALSRLRDGFFWTLGIDSQIHMFKDRWGGFFHIALSDSSADNEELPLRCRDFMVPGQPLWDHSKLSERLPSADVEKIVEVPISSGRVDTLISGDHDSGLYTVRSGYLFLRRPSSPFAPPLRLWKILAKLPVVPKVRSFGWRCGRDALHVGSRLRDVGLSDGACPLCGSSLEDTLHALRDCPDSSLALRQAGFDSSLLSSSHGSAVGWLDFATSVLPQRSLALLLTLLWGLWRRRNTCVHERTLYPLHLVVGNAVSLCHNYVSASAPPLPRLHPLMLPLPLPLSLDGVHLPLAHSGSVLGGFARPIPALGPASTVEASALLTGLEYETASGWASVLVESDAAVLINKLHRPSPDLSLLGGLIAPSRDLLAASRGRLRVGFVIRSANFAAHTLASWACQSNDVISFTSQILLVYVNHELTNSRSNRTPKLYDRIVKLRNEHLRFRIPEIAQNIHPNKQESKVRKHLPENLKKSHTPIPG